jgi:hypothetical protein
MARTSKSRTAPPESIVIERREIVATIDLDPDATGSPIHAAFNVIADQMTEVRAGEGARYQFTYSGFTFSAEAQPDHDPATEVGKPPWEDDTDTYTDR